MSDFDPRWIVIYPALSGAAFVAIAYREARRYRAAPSALQAAKVLGGIAMIAASIYLTAYMASF